MAEYVCIDGPLQGHVYVTESAPPVGGLLTIDLLGIERVPGAGEPMAEAHYQVESSPREAAPGVVRFLAVRGMYRKPALPASLSELTSA